MNFKDIFQYLFSNLFLHSINYHWGKSRRLFWLELGYTARRDIRIHSWTSVIFICDIAIYNRATVGVFNVIARKRLDNTQPWEIEERQIHLFILVRKSNESKVIARVRRPVELRRKKRKKKRVDPRILIFHAQRIYTILFFSTNNFRLDGIGNAHTWNSVNRRSELSRSIAPEIENANIANELRVAQKSDRLSSI